MMPVFVIRAKVGKDLWGEKWRDLLEGGKDADKIDFLIVLRVKKAMLEDKDRRVPGREKAYIIPRSELQQQDDGWHYLTLDHIVRVYCLVDPTAKSAALDARAAEVEETTAQARVAVDR